MKTTFNSTHKDGSPRAFVGMHRPNWPLDPNRPPAYVQCTCMQVLQTQQALLEHWRHGHFDVPIYEGDE